MPTLQQMMLETGVAAGTLVEGATTSLGSTTSLISSPFANTALYDSTTFDEQYALIVSGSNLGEQQPLTAGGLETDTGTFDVSGAYTNAVASGVSFWLCGRLPAIKYGQFEGLRECVNRAHRRMLVRRRIAISGVTSQQKYPLALATYPWMREDSILEIYDPESDALVPLEPTKHKWNYVYNGESPSLEFPDGAPWKTGETAYMEVQCPANSWLKISGVWTNQTSPTAALTTLTDESLVDLTQLIVVALAYVYRELAKWASGVEADEWRKEAVKWTMRARSQPDFMRQQQERKGGIPDLRPTYSGGLRGYGYGKSVWY